MKEKTIKILFITLIAISFIGGSLGYFRPAIMGTGKHNFAVSANLEVTFNDVDTLTLKNNKPIYENDYKYKADYIDFSITGQNNTIEGCYTLYISVKEMTPNLKSEYFKWILYDLNKEQIYLEGDFSSYNNGDLKISNLMQLKRTTNDRYRLYIFLVNDEEENQTELLNSSFSATVKGVSNDACPPTLKETILAADVAISDANIDYAYTFEGGYFDWDTDSVLYDTSKESNGLYYTEDGTEENERVYFYRGRIENNYIIFGDYCWRIVRTVEDGSVRVRYAGEVILSEGIYTCPPKPALNNSVDVTIGNYVDFYINTNNKNDVDYRKSIVKETVESWYRDNIYKNGTNTAVTNLIADTPYCNDMTERVDDTTVYFGAYDRLKSRVTNASNPQYKCPSSTYAYTVAKGDLTYPIALLTADEVAYAGCISSNVYCTGYFLYTAGESWTMSPSHFSDLKSYLFITQARGELGPLVGSDSYSYGAYLSPALSLKNEARVLSGTGLYNDPYVIMTE
ncbi:MAG: hypothetical protein IJB82_00605 [Bacilli bacterium]|nr:hypothetical protein [Bacilli bacterium]